MYFPPKPQKPGYGPGL